MENIELTIAVVLVATLHVCLIILLIALNKKPYKPRSKKEHMNSGENYKERSL